MVDAATGSRAVFGRAVEKGVLGLPLGNFRFLNFNSLDIARIADENPATAITGKAGMDRGTPGEIKSNEKLSYDLTVSRVLFDLVAMFGKPTSITVLTAAVAWLVKIRPSATNLLRAASLYLHEGGSYSPMLQYGRRAADITLKDAANKRTDVDVSYGPPTGDTISGFPIAKTGNPGTFTGIAQVGSRGRRPYDADFTAGKSIYVKVVSSTATSVTLLAKLDVASPGDGTGFPSPGVAYGATNFVVNRPDSTLGRDGWSIVINSTSGLPIGLFGENNEPYEITFGDLDLSTLTALDEFEFPAKMAVLPKVTVAESRLSAFHLIRTLDGSADIRFDSGSLKLERPYKAYYSNGKRLSLAVDPTDAVKATATFKKRLFDRFFRERNDAATRFRIYDLYKIQSPIPTSSPAAFEQVEIFLPQCAVTNLKSGDISNRDTLEETVTLMAEEPDSAVTPPAGFDGTWPVEINVTVPIDPTFLN